ncbi:hypothetical protein C9374_001744 [Naegleria lovaniensis]|uniref:t-SNARE coiled-coil homology domain-containing protein n=1 Tax=Naegleria lovaniensis TaxID=51637 RepID=A0AA88GR90_NAELO|nr:uncharacterized protein C9374_001744 [Naegleria lovaniensis]KAG2387412.1 hypothetical protein C9374_001744 [Naegleria lovaniensis]
MLSKIFKKQDKTEKSDKSELGSSFEHDKTIQSIDLLRCSPGMADLFRRLYQIRIDCGEIVSDGVDKQKQKEMEKQLKKLDKFERQKVLVKTAIDQTETLINQKKKVNDNDPRLNNDINKAITKMEKETRELEKIHQDALNKKTLWKEVQMPVEMRKQRETDIKNFKLYVKCLKQEYTKLLTGNIKYYGEEDDPVGKREVLFESLDSLEKAKAEIPTVDISEGLEQIEMAKRQMEEKTDILLGQIQKIGQIAHTLSDELDKQAQLLDKMAADVDKYNKTLDETNARLVQAIHKAGGATRLLCICVIFIVIVALLGVGWLLLEIFVPSLGMGVG